MFPNPGTPFPRVGVGADGPPHKGSGLILPADSIPRGNACPGCILEGPVEVLSLQTPATRDDHMRPGLSLLIMLQ